MIPSEVKAKLAQLLAKHPKAVQVRTRTADKKRFSATREEDGEISFREEPDLVTPTDGPGTELKKLLALGGINATPLCSCNEMAAEMNRLGPDWCLAHEDQIIAVMEREARRRQLPFMRLVAAQLIRLAVRRARSRPQIAPGPPIDIPALA